MPVGVRVAFARCNLREATSDAFSCGGMPDGVALARGAFP
jgi:hypothetical protein